MKTRRTRRILAKILSRHGTRDLPYKVPELNMQANVKTKNGKNLKVKTLVDSGYNIHI